jgi:hypothetical protein
MIAFYVKTPKSMAMKAIATLATTLVLMLAVQADISLPKKDTPYDRLARGFSNFAFSTSEIFDTNYTSLETDGGTVAFAKGFAAQGPARALSDIGVGLYEMFTAPFPLGPDGSYRTNKQPPHGEFVVNEYPPADLTHWY